jgi:ABC-type multidrug transport system fused ATPase/permease subunit
MVFQETTLFNDSISYNLLYAKPSATMEEVRDACLKANILDFIDSLEK